MSEGRTMEEKEERDFVVDRLLEGWLIAEAGEDVHRTGEGRG